MADKTNRIRVLLVDDSYLVRQSVKAMLEFDEGQFEVAGEAENGIQAVEAVARLKPDVVLMDINMPDMDGISATIKIMEQHPVGVVIISVQGEQEYLRRAMKAGARDYLVKPFTYEELVAALHSAAAAGPNPLAAAAPPAPKHKSKVITVFSTRGGVGKTTIAANLAAGLAQMGGKSKVAAIDLDLEFGVLATMMGVRTQGTILDLCRLEVPITPSHVDRVLAKQPYTGVGVLAAPPLPHLASEVDGEGRGDQDRSYIVELIEALRVSYDYIIIDTSPSFREANLVAMDRSDLILMVTVPEVTALESTAKGLDVLIDRLEYSKEKVHVVLNRADSLIGLTHADIATSLGMSLGHLIPTDERATVSAANTGTPIVQKRSKGTPIADALLKLAAFVAGEEPAEQRPLAAVSAQESSPRPRRILGLF